MKELPTANILVVYYGSIYPITRTIKDYLYSFREYSKHRCYYVNLAFAGLPKYIFKIKFDLIVFDKTFLGSRWTTTRLNKQNKLELLMERAGLLKELRVKKAIFPQDEFYYSDLLCKFIKDFNIDYVFSVAPETEWPLIYKDIDLEKVKFFYVLTGYLSDYTNIRIKSFFKETRDIDIGYRTNYAPPWFGRHGMLKTQIAETFSNIAKDYNLAIDISTEKKDGFLGDLWYKFLARCKYTIGVEGGTSLLDKNGTIRTQTENYQLQHPQASFEEVEAHCFPGQDYKLKLYAISPRHLEACATKTCQILVEGSYNGILIPHKHYIPLKKDFSNIDEIIQIVKEDNIREQITKNAYQDIVESGLYSYTYFVQYVLGCCFDNDYLLSHSESQSIANVYYYISIIQENIYWKVAGIKGRLVSLYEYLNRKK